MNWIAFEKEFGWMALIFTGIACLFLFIIIEVQAKRLKRKREGK